MCSEDFIKPIAKISISVPIYNAEKYLSHCIDCLINQTLKDIEIILVDDGSTDSSGSICDEYAEKDGRIKVVHKENGGSASARQSGFDVANGDYICMCDADDWVELTMYEELYKKALETDADIVMCDYWKEYGGNNRKIISYGKEIPTDNNVIIDAILKGQFPRPVWNKLYKMDFVKANSLYWEPGINMGEDFLMTLKMLLHPLKMVYLPMKLYHYRRLPGEETYTNNVSLNSYNQMLSIHKWICDHLDNTFFSTGIRHNLINIAFAGLRVNDVISDDYLKKTSLNKLSYSDLINERTLKAMVVIFTKLFGVTAGRCLYRSVYKLVYK